MLSRIGLKYPARLHCEKVASFLSNEDRADSIIFARGTQVKNRDNTDTELDFRQESNFLYLTGVQEADFYFVYDIPNSKAYLIAPEENPTLAVWKGPGYTDEQLLARYDVDFVVRYPFLLELLRDEIRPRRIHGWNHPEQGLPLSNKDLERELEHYISHRLIQPTLPTTATINKPSTVTDRTHHHHGPYGDHNGHRCGHHKHRHHGHDCDHDHDHDHDQPTPPPPRNPKAPVRVTILEAFVLARINKTPIEIALSRESTRITSDAHRLIMKSARPGMFEYQLEALFRYECARQGAKNQAYLPIVGTAVNAAYLHYTRNDTQIKDGDLILIDAACEADCYGSDVTRTFPVSGRFSKEQAEIYSLVLEMQTSVIKSMEQGVDWREMATLSQRIGVRGLKRLGILKGDETDLIESGIIRTFYPHGLGHLLGLNVHDDGLGLSIQLPPPASAAANKTEVVVDGFFGTKESPITFHRTNIGELAPPSTRRSRSPKTGSTSLYATPTTRLEPGMLLTVEPGIYFNPAQIERALAVPYAAQYLDEPTLKRYMSVGGVRIEDVVLILPNGQVENITTAPKILSEVERIVQEGKQEYQRSQHMADIPESGYPALEKKTEKVSEKVTPAISDRSPSSEEIPRGIKKRVGVFKKILRAIRNMF